MSKKGKNRGTGAAECVHLILPSQVPLLPAGKGGQPHSFHPKEGKVLNAVKWQYGLTLSKADPLLYAAICVRSQV